MGDFLGATICMTELAVLGTIHSLPKLREIKAALFELISNMGDKTLVSILQELEEKLQLSSLLPLILALLSISLWSYLMTLTKKISSSVTKSKSTAYKESDSDDEIPLRERDGKIENFTGNFLSDFSRASKMIDGLAKPIGSLGTLEEWAAR